MNTEDLRWYVMRTVPEKEQEMVTLVEKKIHRELWDCCRILKKQQLFRTQGKYLLSRRELFSGYVFVATRFPEELAGELQKARQFPQLIGNQGKKKAKIVPVAPEDLEFLRHICGRELEHDMWLSTVRVDEDGQVKSAAGALKPYLDRITRQRLRHRYVTAEVPLFNRTENVLFGIRMEGDPV